MKSFAPRALIKIAAVSPIEGFAQGPFKVLSTNRNLFFMNYTNKTADK